MGAHLITLFEGLCFKWFLLVAQVALSLLCLESPCVCHIIQPQTHTHTTCVSRHKREKRREERREERRRRRGMAAIALKSAKVNGSQGATRWKRGDANARTACSSSHVSLSLSGSAWKTTKGESRRRRRRRRKRYDIATPLFFLF